MLAARDIVWSAGRAILDGVTVEAHAGQVLGILGPNGAGKTSLLRILASLRRPETGAVTLGGRDLRGMRRRIVARRLAIVEQSPEVHGDITVQETAALGRTPHRGTFAALDREDRAAIERALSLTGMSLYRSRTWRSLSGGEQQRAQLARALAQNPEVLVLDEPTNHLDIRYQLDVLALVASLDMTVTPSPTLVPWQPAPRALHPTSRRHRRHRCLRRDGGRGSRVSSMGRAGCSRAVRGCPERTRPDRAG